MKAQDLWGTPMDVSAEAESRITLENQKFEQIKAVLLKNHYNNQAYPYYQHPRLIRKQESKNTAFLVAVIRQIKETPKGKMLKVIDQSSSYRIYVPIPEEQQSQLRIYKTLMPGIIAGFCVRLKFKKHHESENNIENALKTSLKQTTFLSFSLWAQQINYPGFEKAPNELEEAEQKKLAIFLADIHVGSKTFVQSAFLKLINRINNTPEVKYLVLVGDLVDGIGVYPGHGVDLLQRSYILQYNKLGYFLSLLRKDLEVILSCGNHDYVSKVEPQVFSENIKKIILKYRTCHFVSNPGFIELEKRKILIYHGASFDKCIANSEYLNYQNPTSVSRFFMDIRQLSPLLDAVPIKPTTKLYHFIPPETEILVTGHIHCFQVTPYDKDRLLVCTGAWQHLTPYQEAVGLKPDYAICAVIDLSKKNKWYTWDFRNQVNLDEYKHEVAKFKEGIDLNEQPG